MTRYLDFSRLATRSEYWGVLIISWILAAVLTVVTVAMMVIDGVFVFLGGLALLVGFVVLIWAILATTASRCRDAGINPWWTAASLLPYIGFVIMIVIGCLQTRTATPEA